MRKLTRIFQKAEVMGETVKTLVHYPTQAQDSNVLLCLKELRTRGSRVSAPRNEKHSVPWEVHGGEGRFLKRKGKDAGFFSGRLWKGIR